MKLSLSFVLSLCVTLLACAQGGDIVETLEADQSYRTLVAGINVAGLKTTLKGTGPFTLFAPTNEGFNKVLPAGGRDYLFNTSAVALRKVLGLHVVQNKELFINLLEGKNITNATSVEGTLLSFVSKNLTSTTKEVTINKLAKITSSVNATNGVIHYIDTAMIPESVKFPEKPNSCQTTVGGKYTLLFSNCGSK